MNTRLVIVLALFVLPYPASACILCGRVDPRTTQSLREAADQAKFVVYGRCANARLNPEGGGGRVDLHVDAVVKDDPFLAGKKVIELPRYVPITDPKKPPLYLV